MLHNIQVKAENQQKWLSFMINVIVHLHLENLLCFCKKNLVDFILLVDIFEQIHFSYQRVFFCGTVNPR